MPDPVVSRSCPVLVAAVCESTLRRQAATARARVPPLRPLFGHRRGRSDTRHVRTPRCAVLPAFSPTTYVLQSILHACCACATASPTVALTVGATRLTATLALRTHASPSST